jgi:hypothetical protein
VSDEVNRIARLLIAEWERVDDKVNVSRIANFIDMARVVIADRDTPKTDDFFSAVATEAAHQIARWGVDHDAGKRAEDWIALLVYLVGKAAKAHYDADDAKLKHHVVTVAAVCLNWLRNLNGETKAMRPGVGDR